MTSLRSAFRLTICRQRPEKGPIKLMMGWISDITRAIFHVKQALCCAITETPGKGNSIFRTCWFSARLWFGTQDSESTLFPYVALYTVYCLLIGCVSTQVFFHKASVFFIYLQRKHCTFKTVVCLCTATEKQC